MNGHPRRAAAAVLAASLALAGCAPATRPAGASRDPNPPRASRAVLLSFDGVGGERLARLLAEPGKLPAGGFRRIAGRGFQARRLQPPTPSLTAPAHATLATGALPQATGIVSNQMRDFYRPFPARMSGFDAADRAETLWQAAARQGKRVGIIGYPGADGRTPERRADWGLGFVENALSAPATRTIAASAWQESNAAVPGFSPPRRTVLAFPGTAHKVTLVALDSTDDGKTDYDRIRVEPEAGDPAEARPDDWFSVEVPGEAGRAGAWCKLLLLSPDLSAAEVYLGGLHANAAYPEEFRRSLDERVGFWPGPPDTSAFGARSARPEVYLEQADRLADFLTRATLFALARPDWDLLLAYQPEVDEVSHEFFLTDSGQPGWSPERAARFAAFVDAAYALADRSLDRIDTALSSRDAIFVASDHGMVPLRTAVFPDEILRQGGFLRVSSGGGVDPASDAVAIASGGGANVYRNAAAPAGTLEAIERLLRGFQIDGESPWDLIVRRSDAASLGLDAPESGDLILLARPGIALSSATTPGRTSGPPPYLGGHGYRNVYPELAAALLAAGPGIARGRAEEFPSWRVAAWVCRTLGIEPPRGAAP